LGMRHPNPQIPEMRMACELRAVSEQLGLTGSTVLFNEGWLPYDRWAAHLAGADVGVSTHLLHIETHFSFRTRVLDYLSAGLPTVLTEGDTLSAEIAAAGVGVAVPPGDPGAIAAALDAMLTTPPSRQDVAGFAARYAWSAVCGPLLAFAGRPQRAADRTWRRDASPGDPTSPGPVADEIRRLAARIGRGAARRLREARAR
jgi:glycosyltransferase involved in cell wall biosynthesis